MSRAHRIFATACALAGEARRTCLDELCGDDQALRAEVEELLRLDQTPAFLAETRLAALRGSLVAPDPEPPPPAELDGFKVLDLLGRGGMGVVYRAEQQQPRREVALKVMAPGLGSTSARARFALEAEALGRLQHPGIAQIHAAGTCRSAHGEQPWLAMELVRGETLQAWAQRHRPSLAQRLDLLIEIADAVHHAHQRGLIHRDLKPGNVLVDEHGRAKVLDFGVARLVDDDRDQALQTQPGQLLGTLAYMSPEQAVGESARIDVRSDIYSLGVLGYELLAGVLPIDVTTDGMLRGATRLAEEEPVLLGRRDRRLRGDLETIFACALRKEPERRYGSMAAFADDLRRFRRSEPILARPATAAYVFARFVRRHAVALSGVVAVVLGLVIALVASLQATARVEAALAKEAAARGEAERREKETRRQERLKSDVLDVLAEFFAAGDPNQNPEALHQTLSERTAATVARLDTRFADAPETERAVRLALGKALIGRGEYAAAETQIARARATTTATDRQALQEVLRLQADVRWRQHDHQGTLAVLDDLQATCGSAPDVIADETARFRGEVLYSLGRRDEAIELWRRTLAHYEADPDLHQDVLVAAVRANLANAAMDNKDLAGAKAQLEQAMGLLQQAVGPQAEETLGAINSQAIVLYQQGDFAAAADLMQQVLATSTHVFGPDHPRCIGWLQNLAACQLRLRDPTTAVESFQRAIQLGERWYGKDSLQLVEPLANLGTVRWQQKQLDEAAALYQRAIDIRLAKNPAPDKALSGFYNDLGRIRGQQGDKPAMLDMARRSVAIRIEAFGPFHELVLPRRVDLADILGKCGKPAEGLAELRAIDARLPEVLGRSHRATVAAARLMAEYALATGALDEVPACIARLTERAAGSAEEAAARTAAAALTARLEQARK